MLTFPENLASFHTANNYLLISNMFHQKLTYQLENPNLLSLYTISR
jgi:hypothetical protein